MESALVKTVIIERRNKFTVKYLRNCQSYKHRFLKAATAKRANAIKNIVSSTVAAKNVANYVNVLIAKTWMNKTS